MAGWAPLHIAVLYDEKEITKLLISKGSDISAKDSTGKTPLHFATTTGIQEMTPLLYAVWKSHKRIVELLLAKGADASLKNSDGQTPLDLAIEYDDTAIIKILRRHQEPKTPPHLAYSNGQLIIDATVGRRYRVLYSSDLKTWQVLETVTFEESPQVYLDKTAAEQPIRFYQLRSAK